MVISKTQRRKLWDDLKNRGMLSEDSAETFEVRFDPLKEKWYRVGQSQMSTVNDVPQKATTGLVRPHPRVPSPINALGSKKFSSGSKFGLLITSGVLTLGVTAVCLQNRVSAGTESPLSSKPRLALCDPVQNPLKETQKTKAFGKPSYLVHLDQSNISNIWLKGCLLFGAATAAVTLCVINSTQ